MTTNTNATPSVSSSNYMGVCPCGCGQAVEVTFGDFAATEVTVAACGRMGATAGIVSYTMRKTQAPGSVSVGAEVRHCDGLVALGEVEVTSSVSSFYAHLGGCADCRAAVEAHDVETPRCGDWACGRVRLCAVGVALRERYWDV